MEHLEKVYEKLGNAKIVYHPDDKEIVIEAKGVGLMQLHLMACNMFGYGKVVSGETHVLCKNVDETKYKLLLQRVDTILAGEDYV